MDVRGVPSIVSTAGGRGRKDSFFHTLGKGGKKALTEPCHTCGAAHVSFSPVMKPTFAA